MSFQVQEEFVNMAYISKRDFSYLTIYALLTRSQFINISDELKIFGDKTRK